MLFPEHFEQKSVSKSLPLAWYLRLVAIVSLLRSDTAAIRLPFPLSNPLLTVDIYQSFLNGKQ